MERKRLLWGYGAVTVIVLAFIMVLALAIGKPTAQPSAQPEQVSVSGTLACLPHKNTSGPQTTECAIGLRTDDGRYYGLQELSTKDSQTSFNTRVYVSGVSQPPTADTKYDVVGTIKVSTFSTSAQQ